jgi:hypothetical protein
MTAPSFSLGHANDRLIGITCPGIKAISLSGRELRRAAERNKKGQRKSQQSTPKGFA